MKYLIPFSFLIFISCNKFSHSDVDNAPSCSLCSFAKSIEGTYRGEVVVWDYYFTNQTYYDSVTMTVQQMFLGNNSYNDSTVMRFATTRVADSVYGSIIFYDTIEMYDNSGKVYSSDISSRVDEFWIRNDSIRLNYGFTSVSFSFLSTYNTALFKQ